MSKALSLDLRVRVLAAKHAGATHREAADRFGVRAASVGRWRVREREQGDARPKALAGDRRSQRIRAHHAAVLASFGPRRDASIEAVRGDLAAQGLSFGFGAIQRFFARHRVTRKKDEPSKACGPPLANSSISLPRRKSKPLHRRGYDAWWSDSALDGEFLGGQGGSKLNFVSRSAFEAFTEVGANVAGRYRTRVSVGTTHFLSSSFGRSRKK